MTPPGSQPVAVDSSPRSCAGPVYFGDQGIEVCETCGDCICCEPFDAVDHTKAVYRCERGNNGVCWLKGNRHFPNHECEAGK